MSNNASQSSPTEHRSTSSLDESRWEAGSSFHFVNPPMETEPWLPEKYSLTGTGRQAIVAAFLQGRQEGRWSRLLVPTYFCPSVVRSLKSVIPIGRYECGPSDDNGPSDLAVGDVVLSVSYFGRTPNSFAWDQPLRTILDVTHDPLAAWLEDLCAAYVVASLRKTLPIPDGGIIWSPAGFTLPDQNGFESAPESATGLLQGMRKKAKYFVGQFDEKNQYLEQMSIEAERLESDLSICEASDYTIAVLPQLPVYSWRKVRQSNIEALSKALEGLDAIRIWPSTFGVILILPETRTRDWLRERLKEKSIYSAVLWHPSEVDQDSFNVNFGHRMLHIHADFRYDPADIRRIAKSISAVWADRDSLNIIQAAPNIDV